MAADLKRLGRFDLIDILGEGGMGVVYEGVDPKLHRRVAIKTILKRHFAGAVGKDYSMRFAREAQAVARLNHPNIVQLYDFGEEGDIAYLVMEFVKGKELKTFFDANQRFDMKDAIRIMHELCEALEFAHNAGIVHRDVKPANVMLDSEGRVKLTDFGVARILDTDSRSAEGTQGGTMVGTPAYMSPEQIAGSTVDKRTDIFSAGIILYEFLTGAKPFTGGGAWTVAKKIMQDDPPIPSSLNSAVTPFFDDVVNRALAKDRVKRYQSARELSVALRRALEGVREKDDTYKTSAPPQPAAELKTQPAAGGTKRSPAAAIVVGIIVLAIAGVGYFFIPKGDPEAAAKFQAMQKELEAVRQKAAQLEAQQKRDEEARFALENARKAEDEAKKTGDLKHQQALAEARAKAEAEAKKQAEFTRLLEAEAKRTAEAAETARKQTQAKQQADAKREAEREALAAETALWNSIRNSTTPSDFDEYLKRYPNGQYAALAKASKETQLRHEEQAKKLASDKARLEEEQRKIREQALPLQKKEAEKRTAPLFVPPSF